MVVVDKSIADVDVDDDVEDDVLEAPENDLNDDVKSAVVGGSADVVLLLLLKCR